jgi:hypothetical protein
MTDRSTWKKVEPVVRKVIRDWDPSGLFELGAPDNEHDREILQIVGRVGRIRNSADAVAVLIEVFTPNLRPEELGREDFVSVGKKLFDALDEAGIIETAEQSDV